MRQRQWIALAACAALIGIGYFLGRNATSGPSSAQRPAEPQRTDGVAQAGTAAHPPTGRPTGRARAITPTSALPAPGTSLAQVFDELKARTQAGDGEAASRLFSDLGKCHQWHVDQLMWPDLLPGALNGNTANSSPEELAQTEWWLSQTQKMMDFVRTNAEMCAKVDLDQLDETVPAMLAAARAGDLKALDCYLSLDMSIMPGRLIDHPEWLTQYKQNALPLAEWALEQGDWHVVQILQFAYNGGDAGSALLGKVVGPDPNVEQAYRYMKLQRLGATGDYAVMLDLQLPMVSKSLSKQQVAAADAWANNTFARHFNGTSSNALANWTSGCPDSEP